MPRVTITVPDKTPQPYRFQLDRQSVTLGRGSENDIAIDCGSISVKHAEMLRVEGGYELRDLGSTNGIKLDGERKEVIRLRSGIGVKLGDVSFDFLLSDEELDILARENPGADASNRPESSDRTIDLPPLKPEPGREAPVPVATRGGGGGGGGLGMIVLFLILAAAAFFAGMAVRFQKETGGSLIDAIKAKAETSETSKPAPAPASAPAEPAEPAAGEGK
jgi:pSer/pThr/pTyr-binding forkhead associated (FHA) protein